MAARDIGACQPHFRAQRFHVRDLFLRHLVWNHQQYTIAFCASHQRESKPGVAGRRLDHSSAWLQTSIALSSLNHGQADAIFDGASRILIFEFEKKLARPGVELRDLHQWCIADQRKNRRRFAGRNRWRSRSLDHSKAFTRFAVRLYVTT